MSKLVEIAVPIPLKGLFTYGAPEEFAAMLQIGRRVIIPFGSKIRSGFIVGFQESPPAGVEIKNIISVPDEAPYFSPVMWNFYNWIADYYMCSAGLTLKTALPPGSDKKSSAWVRLTPEGMDWPTGRPDLTFPPKFLKSSAISRKELESAIGRSVVEHAVKDGFLTVEQRIAKSRSTIRPHDPFVFLEAENTPAEVPELTEAQSKATAEINSSLRQNQFAPFLLYGVTGSGKTEVYLQAINTALEEGKRVLALVPEIALTPQLAFRFMSRVQGRVSVFHSGYTAAQRKNEWRRIAAGKIQVVIAARSGIFLPMDDLGLIIVDEEHDSSYKQSDGCPYNARDMAIARAKMQNASIILGSATPSFETFINCNKGKIKRLDLPTRFHGGALPKVELVNLKECKISKTSLLTPTLLQSIEATLDKKEQAIIFLNRRGFDTFALCKSCGFVFKCPNCDISLTHHKKSKDLKCHLCGYAQISPPLCPKCHSEKVFFGGIGTQKLEEELIERFPNARVERLDSDTSRKRENLESILKRFREREIDILTGTQIIVKGHDFPGISLVGVLCGDASLHFPDFRSGERTFQMLTQVAGRTGRESDSGKVILQTFDPTHEAIARAAVHDYEGYFEWDSITRRELLYPPYGYLILIRVDGADERRVESKAIKIGRAARILKSGNPHIQILGPAPAPIKKIIGKFRWQILLKSPERSRVRLLTRRLIEDGHLTGQGVRVVIDVDPIELM